MKSIDDTSNFDDFPDVEIGLGELGKAKNGKKKEAPPHTCQHLHHKHHHHHPIYHHDQDDAMVIRIESHASQPEEI